MRTVAGSGRIARATPRSRMIGPTTSPLPAALGVTPRRAAPQPDAGGVDRFLSERPKSLSLKRNVVELDLAAEEELLETIVHGARQHHAAQDLAAFVRGQRRRDGFAVEEAVACVNELVARGLQPRCRRHSGRRVGQAVDRDVAETLARAPGRTADRRSSIDCLIGGACEVAGLQRSLRPAGSANGYRSTTNAAADQRASTSSRWYLGSCDVGSRRWELDVGSRQVFRHAFQRLGKAGPDSTRRARAARGARRRDARCDQRALPDLPASRRTSLLDRRRADGVVWDELGADGVVACSISVRESARSG